MIPSRRLNIASRKRLLHCFVWPILLCGCESWTIKEDLRKRLEAFEMLKISWTQKVANFGKPSKRKKGCFSCASTKLHDAGNRRIGRKRKSWLRNIIIESGLGSRLSPSCLALREKIRNTKKLTANLH
ncbi:jg204 [Pararge aegeria aegeria]|uniref:Jg204 protein n=1 Tax=Pararge aegeria aegeria TaxID=348720 RepID=A0A8S4QFY3_9NEOP|nr:jg204 [Pararge aegeria aegeria]